MRTNTRLLMAGIAIAVLAGCEQLEQAATEATEQAKQTASKTLEEARQVNSIEDAKQTADNALQDVKQQASGWFLQAYEILNGEQPAADQAEPETEQSAVSATPTDG